MAESLYLLVSGLYLFFMVAGPIFCGLDSDYFKWSKIQLQIHCNKICLIARLGHYVLFAVPGWIVCRQAVLRKCSRCKCAERIRESSMVYAKGGTPQDT
jgi:hypothetical protein